MKIIESLLTKNRCYQKGEKIVVKGLMLHSIGCPQPSAKALVQSWNSASAGTCVHAFIDGNSGEIYQTLPWNHRAWHCGSGNKGSGNNFYIAVEMCEPACIKYTSGANFTCSNLVEARPCPGDCQQPRRSGTLVDTAWFDVYNGWIPQGGKGDNE